MERTSLHLEVRNALALADELSRFEHASGNDTIAGNLRALRTSLDELEREIGGGHEAALSPVSPIVHAVHRSIEVLVDRTDEIPRSLAIRFATLVAIGRRVAFAVAHPDEPVPAKPLLGVLPLARVVPQDAHTVFDWLASAACAASSVVATSARARSAGVAFAASGAGVALTTDCRLSPIKAIPLETHEAIDYAWGASVALAPFVLGYAKRDRLATILQVAAGFGTILVSLFTDYRAALGRTRPHRSNGGPDARARRRPGHVNGEAQRPLEGFSYAPTTWDV